MYYDENGIWTEAAQRFHLHDEGLESGIVSFCREVFGEFTSSNHWASPIINDLGCGPNKYLAAIEKQLPGVNVTGFDGFAAPGVVKFDLAKEVFSRAAGDLTLCLEVGEHIPAEFYERALDNIARSTFGTLIFSWAKPGQGGLGHVNELPLSTVVQSFNDRGLFKSDDLTQQIKDAACFGYFKENLVVMTRCRQATSLSDVYRARACPKAYFVGGFLHGETELFTPGSSLLIRQGCEYRDTHSTDHNGRKIFGFRG